MSIDRVTEYPDVPSTFVIADNRNVDNNSSIKIMQVDGRNFVSKSVTHIDPFVLIETNILATLNHENIISLLDTVDSDEVEGGDTDVVFYLILPVMAYTLDDLISSGELSLDRKQDYVHQIASGLRYLHENEIVHTDLKSRNIMVHRSGNVDVIKIIDFDASEYLVNGTSRVLLKCTTTYRPPEGFSLFDEYTGDVSDEILKSLASEDYYRDYWITKQFDIWSFGIVIVELLTGVISYRNSIFPFYCSDRSSYDVSANLCKHRLYEKKVSAAIVSKEFDREFRRRLPNELRSMLSIDPKARPGCDEVMRSVSRWRGVACELDTVEKVGFKFLGFDESYVRFLKIFKETEPDEFSIYPPSIKRATHYLLKRMKELKGVSILADNTIKTIIRMCHETVYTKMDLRRYFTIEDDIYERIVKKIVLMTKGKFFYC